MTGVSECSQQRGNLKDNRYRRNSSKIALTNLNHAMVFLLAV
ncbi:MULTISPECIES: hypothetical protein [Photorhabdus]|nr:hypothetical protein [Photorhabdus asymbiotica]